MKLHYYPETDSLYIELKDAPGAETREIAEGLLVDFDAKGDVVGLDIDHAFAEARPLQGRDDCASGGERGGMRGSADAAEQKTKAAAKFDRGYLIILRSRHAETNPRGLWLGG